MHSHFALNWCCCALGESSSGGIWKYRTSSFKCYVDHSHTTYSSGNIDVQNWVHLFESRCIFSYSVGHHHDLLTFPPLYGRIFSSLFLPPVITSLLQIISCFVLPLHLLQCHQYGCLYDIHFFMPSKVLCWWPSITCVCTTLSVTLPIFITFLLLDFSVCILSLIHTVTILVVTLCSIVDGYKSFRRM